jgi:carbon storage regulator CsrA
VTQSASHEKEFAMLVLSRRSQESVVIGGACGSDRVVRITVIDVRNGMVKLGIEADADVPVHRSEVWGRIFPGVPQHPTPRRARDGPAAEQQQN